MGETRYIKCFGDGTQPEFQVEYGLLICSAEWGEAYGVEIVKTDADGQVEKEQVYGLSENRALVESFIDRLVEGAALPVELITLCDDFISENEETQEEKQEEKKAVS